jgi:hypothetical protein
VTSSLLLLVVIGLLLILVGGVGYLYGYDQGTADGYSWQQFRVIPGGQENQVSGMQVTYDTPRVTTTDTYAVGQYSIRFVDQLPNETAGYTTMANDIVLESGHSLFDTYRMCVHEKLHNMAPTSPHEWIYDNADITVDKTCLTLLYKLEEGY